MSEHVEHHGARIDRVEQEVQTIRQDLGGIKSEMSGMKAQMGGFGAILQRIEQGVASAQERQDHERQASKMNPIAFASVLITIITIIVGGAWLISGELARHDERSKYQQRLLDRVEQRVWDHRRIPGGYNGAGEGD